jgi:hypothetical protein
MEDHKVKGFSRVCFDSLLWDHVCITKGIIFLLKMLIVLMIMLACSVEVKGMEIVTDGRVIAAVVVSDKPTKTEIHAGILLCEYLSKMASSSNISQPIKPSNLKSFNGDSIILIGRPETNKAINMLVEKGLVNLSVQHPGGDGIFLKTLKNENLNYLVLGGSSDQSVLYAVVHFLEHFGKIGVFWDGEYIPERRSWVLDDIDINEKPYFPVRQYMQGCAFSYSYMVYWDLAQQKKHLDWAAWKKQNRLMWPSGLTVNKENADAYEKFSYDNFQKSKKYAREVLGMEIIGDGSGIYNYDPYPEERASEDPEEEDRIITEFVKDTYKKIPAEGTWFASGWALLNPGWRKETAEAFFDAIGDRKFIIADIWAEANPMYKKYDYFYGHDWLFGVLHSFGGCTTLHGNCADLIRKTQAMTHDPKANHCIGYYINPEVLMYNDFYFDLAARLSWNPNDVKLQDFVKDYTERRYGKNSSSVMAKAYQELLESVYSTNDTTGPFWELRMETTFSSITTTRIGFIPHLEKALEIALSQKDVQHDNQLYRKDLVDIAKQLVAEVGNGHSLRLYNSFLWDDKEKFEQSAKAIKNCLDIAGDLMTSREEYYIGPVLQHIYSYPGMTEKRKKDAEMYFKDDVLTFALRGDNLRDYNSRDIKEVFDAYYRPRTEAYLDYLTGKFNNGDCNFVLTEIEPEYKKIEEKWMETPIVPINAISPGISDVEAVEQALREMKLLSAALVVDPEFTIKNGGFEEGDGKPAGWVVVMQNVEVTVPRDVKPYMGFYALHFSASEELNNTYKTFSATQTIRWQDKSRILLGYCLEKYSNLANAFLKVQGYDSEGKERAQVLYFWGGESWDLKNEAPGDVDEIYHAAQKLEMPQKGMVEQSAGSMIQYKVPWQELDQIPSRDLDEIHGAGTWAKLGIESVSLTIGTWVYENNNNYIDGWFDELRVVTPPTKE